MKKLLLITFISSTTVFSFGQTQIGNSDFEQWETVANGEEPVNWNSFLTAQGTWSGFASDQMTSSTDVRPGTTGTKSCRIFSKSTLGVIANGNVTLGIINMGSTTPTSSSNYNMSMTSDPNFSEAMTDQPDSIVFWVKFTPVNGNDNARMKATLHGAYDYRDPEDAGSTAEVTATAVINFPSTNGNWVRMAVPFDYSGPQPTNAYILVTFTTNELAGGGSDADELLIDDVELIYNTNGVNEIESTDFIVSMNNENNTINIQSDVTMNGEYVIYSTTGQTVQSGSLVSSVDFNQKPGVYFVKIIANKKTYSYKVLKN